MWRSLVARLVWDQEAAGSNPAAPIRARSSTGQSAGFLTQGLEVRVLPGALRYSSLVQVLRALVALLITPAEWVVVDAGGLWGMAVGTPDQVFLGLTTTLGRIFK